MTCTFLFRMEIRARSKYPNIIDFKKRHYKLLSDNLDMCLDFLDFARQAKVYNYILFLHCIEGDFIPPLIVIKYIINTCLFKIVMFKIVNMRPHLVQPKKNWNKLTMLQLRLSRKNFSKNLSNKTLKC